MRIPLLSLALLLAIAPVPARGQDSPKAIIEKGIEARGGAAALDKYIAGRVSEKGTINLHGTEFPFTSESVYQLPDRIRVTVEVNTMGIRRSVTQVFSGGRMAMLVGGMGQQVPTSQVEETKIALYVQNVARLTPLLKEDRYRLAPLPDKTVDEKTLLGVKVSSDGARDIGLYFEKDSGLLVMVERPGFDAQGKPVDQQERYSNFRETNGLKYPTKTVIRQNDKRYLESETTEFKPLERVDAREFNVNQ